MTLAENNKSFLGRGWAFPPAFEKNGAFGMVELEADIKESLYILLSTVPGERIMNPKFGCDLNSQVFKEITGNTLSMIKSTIGLAILNFEPRIDLDFIEFDDTDERNGKLMIRIHYTIRSINSRTNMVYPFYFKEGTNLPD